MFYLSYAMVITVNDNNINKHNQINTSLSWMAIEYKVVNLASFHTKLLEYSARSTKPIFWTGLWRRQTNHEDSP